MTYKAALIIGSGLIAIAQTQTVSAQETGGQDTARQSGAMNNAIIVTARRQEETLQDVPVAVTAVNRDLIDALGATGLEDISKVTPGFTFDEAFSIVNSPVIRGQAQGRLSNPVQNVATFFNGLYLQRAFLVDAGLLDIEQVEVIKGPQSALYGRNAFSGAISFVTAKPDLNEITGQVQLTVGTDERIDYQAGGSIPLIDDMLAVSLSYSNNSFDGTWENNAPLADAGLTTDGNVGGYDNESVMAQVAFEPTDWLRIDGFYAHREYLQEAPAVYRLAAVGLNTEFSTLNCNPFEEFNQAARGEFALFCGAFPAEIELAPGEPRSEGFISDPRAFALRGESDIFSGTVTAEVSDMAEIIYQYGRIEATASNLSDLSRDPINGASGLSGFLSRFNGRSFLDSRNNADFASDSHELRLNFEVSDRFSGKIGGYYSDSSDFDFGGSYAAIPNRAAPLNECVFTSTAPECELFGPFSARQLDTEVKAIFGAVEIGIGDTLSLTAEARYTWEELTDQALTVDTREAIAGQPALNREFDYFTPRVILDWKPVDDLLLYGSVAKGVKSGGFNSRAISPLVESFEPETNWTYEIGAKAQLLGGRMTINASAYYVDWSDIQFDQVDPGGTIGTPSVIGNLSGVKIAGFEIEGSLRIADPLSITYGIGYNDADINDGTIDPQIVRGLCPTSGRPEGTVCPFDGDVSGNSLPRAPSTQGFLALNYEQPVSADFDLNGRFGLSYQDRSFTDYSNTSWAEAHTLFDASLALSSDRFTLRLWGKNIFDKKYSSFSFATFGVLGAGSGPSYAVLAGERRTIGLTASAQY